MGVTDKKEIYHSEFCHLYWYPGLNTVCEDWKIANCPFQEFEEMLLYLLEFCREKKIRNLIIDAFGAISLLPEQHHQWLDESFNSKFVVETEVDRIFMIVPESLVTSISVNRYYNSIRMNDYNIKVFKMKKLKEALTILETIQNP